MAMDSGGLSGPLPPVPELRERTIENLERRLTDLEKRVRWIEAQAEVERAQHWHEDPDDG